MKYLLDTHVWIWWFMQPDMLSPKVRKLLHASDQYRELLLSVISVWEFCKLIEKGRITISCDTQDWIKAALQMPKLRLVHITPEISYKSTILTKPFHDDPADQIIVATAREEQATLITKDERLLEYPHVKAVW